MEYYALKKNPKTGEFDRSVVIIKIIDKNGVIVAVFYDECDKILRYDYVESFKIK